MTAVTSKPLSADELHKLDAYWRASNYLSVGQIYLYDNPLLRQPPQREHVKPRLLGHWVGILFATLVRSMPQLALLVILVVLPFQLLSGSITPRESMPEAVRTLMLAAPTTHFVNLAQAVPNRGAGLDVVWPQLCALVAIGSVAFLGALARFRRSVILS